MLKAKFGFRYPVPHDVKKIQVSIDGVTQDLDVTRILFGTRFNVETTQAVEFETSAGLLKDLPRDGLVLEFLMNEGAGTTLYDTSRVSPPNNGSIVGATWQQLATGKWVLCFDGVDDCVEVSYSPVLDTTTVTMCVWVKIPTQEIIGHAPIVNRNALSNYWPAIPWQLRFSYDSKFRLIIGDGSSNQILAFGSYEFDNWYFVAGVVTGSELLGYVNGKLAGSTTQTITPTTTTNPLGIARANDRYDPQIIGLVAIYSRALDESEIAEIFETTRVYFGV